MVRIDLLSILIESNSWRRSTVTPPFSRTNPDDLRVDSAGDAVLEFQVHLWYRILIEHGGVRDVTDGSGLNHVANGEPLDGFVFRGTSGTIGAANWFDMATPILVATIGCSLLHHDCCF